MAFPQYGQVPDVTPGLAATGLPQDGHSPIWTLLSLTPSTADGLKHIVVSFRLRPVETPRFARACFLRVRNGQLSRRQSALALPLAGCAYSMSLIR